MGIKAVDFIELREINYPCIVEYTDGNIVLLQRKGCGVCLVPSASTSSLHTNAGEWCEDWGGGFTIRTLPITLVNT